jgi:hypothetical protein
MHPPTTALHVFATRQQANGSERRNLALSSRLSAKHAVGRARNSVGTLMEHFTYVKPQARTRTSQRATSALAAVKLDTSLAHTGRSATDGRVSSPAREALGEAA